MENRKRPRFPTGRARPNFPIRPMLESPGFEFHQQSANPPYFPDRLSKRRGPPHIAVRVKTRLPSNAFLLAREPLSRLLDVCVRSVKQPLVYQRLDLVSPRDGGILAQELVLAPSPVGVRLGPLGGFDQSDLFAPHDAIVREAITNPSPYYQLLCAYRLYEGTGALRRWLRQETQRLGIDARLPSDAVIATGELEKMGLPAQVAQGIAKANDLFKKFGDARNGIAHFLFDADSGEHHMYLADGGTFQHYSVASAVLLRYARQALEDLREFYRVHLHTRRMIGSVLPTDSRDERFVVTDEP